MITGYIMYINAVMDCCVWNGMDKRLARGRRRSKKLPRPSSNSYLASSLPAETIFDAVLDHRGALSKSKSQLSVHAAGVKSQHIMMSTKEWSIA
eukprot:scaffold1046_cov136-Skeletonema_dohrnii-CCMP3373.AAC.9